MRGIAQLAHVGLGTLFSYADDKRDLVFLVFNDDLARLTRRALAAPDPATPVIDQLMAVFTPHYRRFAREPALSRLALQELTFYASGKQAQTFRGIRDELMNGLRALLDRAQARGGLARTAPAGVIAQLVFHVYSGALRTWIAGERPGAANGLRELRQLLELALSGLTRGSVARPD
jgi:AcrR family transcriptional regulator